MNKVENKKIFLISVTDKANTKNRKFQEVMLDLFNSIGSFSNEYIIEAHNQLYNENLYDSIEESIRSYNYEGYIVILDCLDKEKGLCNPNVMFEFGAIKFLDKPFVVVATNENEDYPFDVRNLNIETIPMPILDYVSQCYNNKSKSEINKFVYSSFSSTETQKEIEDFLQSTYSKYVASCSKKATQKEEIKSIDLKEISEKIDEIKLLLNDTAQYIEGEENAFNALQEAVDNAKFSLRTTRFANQTIVAEDSPTAQKEFMDSLYKASIYLKDNFTRIICNNHPLKWKDIYNILFYGGNGSKVYIRKHDFSIHFELVIIDEKTAFIHFYQNNSNKINEKAAITNSAVERINSTLKIEGKNICQKLANIFDRLHHRDFRASEPQDPSRTLLGLPIRNENMRDEYRENGYFVLGENVLNYRERWSNHDRRSAIIKMFKDAFQTWIFDDNNTQYDKIINIDKINMIVGIALLESKCDFIEEMKNEKLSQTEYEEAMKQFHELR